jgi:DNA-binding CsgD family transcriptional regulator/tetratricopeptide (TPR) repeat protein
VYVTAPPPLVGRADLLRELLVRSAERPGVIVVAGEPGAGATRVAREAGARLAIDGAVLIDADGDGPGQERLARALQEAGHRPDLSFEARLRPMVALMGDVAQEAHWVRAQARRLQGSRALAIYTARDVVADTLTLELGRLSPEDSTRLARGASPEIGLEAAEAAGELGDGLPGRIVPLALAARRWPGGDVPLPIPAGLARWARERLEPVDPLAREIARWAAIAGTPTTTRDLARVCRMDASHVERALASLTSAGILDELDGPPGPRWRFRDRLVAAALAAELGGADRRRRHTAALVSARSWGATPAELLRHALGAAEPEAVVDYGVRSAEAARVEGAPRRALVDADRALSWWSAEMGPARRLAALHQRGMALLDLSAWSEAAEDLEGAAEGWRALRRPDAAIASAFAASNARWSLGQHDAALSFLRGHLGSGREPGAPASVGRAEALAQAAGMAVMASRFADAVGLAQEAHSEAVEAEADEVATRALIFEGMAESGRGVLGGLAHLARARRQGQRAAGAGQRNETLAMIHESHVLLALGRPDEAAARARAGADRAHELGLVDHGLVLTGNLGEALAAAGELGEARQELERAAEGWTALGRGTPSPADPGLAWLLYAEGRIDEALMHYRSLARVAAEGAVFEQITPVATGHALAASIAGAEAEAQGVLASAMRAWAATDDRLASIPLLAAVAEVADMTQAARATGALAQMAADGSPLAGPFHAVAEGWLIHRRGMPDGGPRLRTAAAGFTAMGMRWWGARALFAAGSMDGRSERAADDLLTARRIFREMGAEGWQRRAEARLRAIGRRIPTRSSLPFTPTAGLSAREIEVLEQLSLGLRNRDIGARLFISERTVARHLAQIYTKLGVPNRTSAVRAAHQRGLIAT